MSLRQDDAGAIQVVEAILVAVLVAGALIFFALSNHPAPPLASSANQGTLAAADALAVLQGSSPGGSSDRLQNLVNDALNGTSLSSWRTNVTAVLPDGVHWSIRIFTGFGRIELLNDTNSTPLTPSREVAGSHAFVQINTSWILSGGALSPTPLAPGDALGFTFDQAYCTITAAPGGTTGPGGISWTTLWLDGQANTTTVPDFAPFGGWTFNDSRSNDVCDTTRNVGVSTAPASSIPYSLELVVWNVY